jgi:hypothetical protein
MDDKFYVAFTAWGTWAAVIIAFFIAWRQNHSAKQLTSFQLFLQLAAQWDSADMHQKRAQLARSLLANPKTLELDDTVLVFFETLAHMARRRLIDHDLVWTTFSVDLASYWAAIRHYAEHVRKEFTDPTLFEEMEALNKQFTEKDRAKHGAPNTVIGMTEPAIRRFLEWEVRRGEPVASKP